MAEIQRSRTIGADVDEIWNKLADFGALSSWADSVDHSCILNSGPNGALVGTSRRVQLGRNVLVERIIEVDAPVVLAYEISGLPRRVRRVTNRWTVDTGLVTLTSLVEIGSRPGQRLAERVLCRVLARQSDALLAGLANRLENVRV